MLGRPDLDQSAFKRAWKGAEWWTLDTFFGALVTVAAGAAGGSIGDSVGIGLVAGAVIGAAIGFGFFLVAEMFRSYRAQRNELRNYLRERERLEKTVAKFKKKCWAWIQRVRGMLDAQEARTPRLTSSEVADSLMSQKPERAERVEQEADRITSETMSVYIQKHREEGVRHFDLLRDVGAVQPSERAKIAKPANLAQLRDGLDTMEFGVERV